MHRLRGGTQIAQFCTAKKRLGFEENPPHAVAVRCPSDQGGALKKNLKSPLSGLLLSLKKKHNSPCAAPSLSILVNPAQSISLFIYSSFCIQPKALLSQTPTCTPSMPSSCSLLLSLLVLPLCLPPFPSFARQIVFHDCPGETAAVMGGRAKTTQKGLNPLCGE